jgi:hypothetical protein
VCREFVNLRKTSISFVMSVRLSAWNDSAVTGGILMKLGIWAFFSNICWENSSFVKIWQE